MADMEWMDGQAVTRNKACGEFCIPVTRLRPNSCRQTRHYVLNLCDQPWFCQFHV